MLKTFNFSKLLATLIICPLLFHGGFSDEASALDEDAYWEMYRNDIEANLRRKCDANISRFSTISRKW